MSTRSPASREAPAPRGHRRVWRTRAAARRADEPSLCARRDPPRSDRCRHVVEEEPAAVVREQPRDICATQPIANEAQQCALVREERRHVFEPHRSSSRRDPPDARQVPCSVLLRLTDSGVLRQLRSGPLEVGLRSADVRVLGAQGVLGQFPNETFAAATARARRPKPSPDR